MESSFYCLDKDWDDKSNKKKPKKKKKWLLSRQYLQPFEEPDDADEEPINDLSVRDKIKCICRSAFYGMKEGLLTGVFLGGVYGVLKLLNGNSSILFASAPVEDNKENEKILRSYHGGWVPHERKSPGRTRRVDTGPYFSSNRRQSSSHSGSISYEDNLLSHRIIEEALYNFSRVKKPQYLIATRRARNTELSYSRLPVKTDKHSEPKSRRAGDKEKYYQNTNEKIKIVSFAFVKTTGAFETELTTSKSVAHGSPKQSKSELENKGVEKEGEEEEDEQELHQQKNRPSVESSKSGVPRPTSNSLKGPKKSALSVNETPSESLKSKAAAEKRQKSLKAEGSVVAANREKSLAVVRSGHANIADDSVPPGGTESKESAAKGLQKAPSLSRSIISKVTNKQSIANEAGERKQKISRIARISPKNNSRETSPVRAAEKRSSLFIKSLEPDQSETSARSTKELHQESRSRFKESNKPARMVSKHSVRDSIIVETETYAGPDAPRRTSRGSKAQKRFDNENVYPASCPPSYLVNPEDVSNGYGSPVTISSGERESEHDTIHSKFSENSFTPDIEIDRADFEDIGFTPSDISEFQIGSPFRAFSPLMSTTQTDQTRTLASGVRDVKEYQESSTTRGEESESAAGSRLRDGSRFSSSVDSPKRPVDFSDSERIESGSLGSALSGGPAAQPSEKLMNSSDQVSGKSHVVESFNRSLLLRQRVLDNSRVIGERVSDQCSEKSNASLRDPYGKSFSGDLAGSSSSLIQDASPETGRSKVQKGAPAGSRTHKANPYEEELKEFGSFSSVTDNAIVVYACNCALVLGILCTVISTTRASLKL